MEDLYGSKVVAFLRFEINDEYVVYKGRVIVLSRETKTSRP